MSPMFGRRPQFTTAGLPQLLPPLPSKGPAGEMGADFDVGFEPMGDEYNKQYYEKAFSKPPAMFGQAAQGLGQMAGEWWRDREMPQWQPQNEAARAIQGGEYADPLLRQSAQWNAPDLGFSGWFGRNFGSWF